MVFLFINLGEDLTIELRQHDDYISGTLFSIRLRCIHVIKFLCLQLYLVTLFYSLVIHLVCHMST